jgi:hypothetical protein
MLATVSSVLVATTAIVGSIIWQLTRCKTLSWVSRKGPNVSDPRHSDVGFFSK